MLFVQEEGILGEIAVVLSIKYTPAGEGKQKLKALIAVKAAGDVRVNWSSTMHRSHS